MVWKLLSDIRNPQVGEEPDARFTLANERTFLAWNRSALGLVVAGLAVAHLLKPDDSSSAGPKVAGVALIALGGVLAMFGLVNWARAQMALRMRSPLPISSLPIVVSSVIVVVALTTMFYSLI